MNIDNNVFVNNMCSYTLRIYENQFNILGFEKGDEIINYSELQKSSKIQEKIISQFKKILEENDLFYPRDCSYVSSRRNIYDKKSIRDCTRGYLSSRGNIYDKKNIISRVYFFEQFIELYMKKCISATELRCPSQGGKYPPKKP
jgi:trehalose/maltose hydrolase-like predicted phosphorylase